MSFPVARKLAPSTAGDTLPNPSPSAHPDPGRHPAAATQLAAWLATWSCQLAELRLARLAWFPVRRGGSKAPKEQRSSMLEFSTVPRLRRRKRTHSRRRRRRPWCRCRRCPPMARARQGRGWRAYGRKTEWRRGREGGEEGGGR
jgi:hypothetical protein